MNAVRFNCNKNGVDGISMTVTDCAKKAAGTQRGVLVCCETFAQTRGENCALHRKGENIEMHREGYVDTLHRNIARSNVKTLKHIERGSVPKHCTEERWNFNTICFDTEVDSRMETC